MVGIAIISTAACTSVPVSPESHGAHIGITLSSHTLIPLKLFDRRFTTIYFARLEDEQNDLISKFPLIPSSARFGNRFYLLNAPPGRYVAVAAFEQLPGSTVTASGQQSTAGGGYKMNYHAVFSIPLVALTEVKAEQGRLVFMGQFLISVQPLMWGPKLDEVQTDVKDRLLGRGSFSRGSVKEVEQGVGSEHNFLMEAQDDLGESVWGAIIQHSQEVLRTK
ncbi:MAG: hypothetical protein ABI618_16090 [Nitrospirota bacterium]